MDDGSKKEDSEEGDSGFRIQMVMFFWADVFFVAAIFKYYPCENKKRIGDRRDIWIVGWRLLLKT